VYCFFAKKPSEYIRSSIVRCLHFKDVERINILDKKEIDKGIIGNIEFAINYIRERVPVEFKIVGSRREEYPEYHEEAYREAIVNAIVHRNYYEIGPDTSIEKLKDRIFINNPGGLLSSFPKEQFGKVSWPRNKLIADLLSRTIFMEKVGTGIKRIEAFCKDNGNHEKIYAEENYFFVEIYSNQKVGEKVGEKLTKNQCLILKFMSDNPDISIAQLSKKVGIAEKNIEINISKLKQKHLLKRICPAKGGYWEVEKE